MFMLTKPLKITFILLIIQKFEEGANKAWIEVSFVSFDFMKMVVLNGFL